MQSMRIVLTGTPGTGKTFIAKGLARALDVRLVDANALAKKKRLWANRRRHEVDLRDLKRELQKTLAGEKKFVVEGHLLCEFPLECDLVVVLRCNPGVLVKRLRRRGYSRKKIAENVLAEILDYCLIKAIQRYGSRKAIQIDCTRMPSTRKLLKKIRFRRGDDVDWMPFLLKERFKKALGV